MLRVVMPQIFENMEEATVGKWLKSEGETVTAGDALCELITEKTTLDLQAEAGGLLRRLVVPEKAVVPPGYVVALIGEAGEELPEVDAENAALLARRGESAAEPAPALQVTAPPAPASSPSAAGSRLRATPAARRAARELGVELEAVAAAFPGKVLSEEDVKAFAAQ